MNMNVLDATEHGSLAKHRPHRCNWLMALACVWMTLPLLAWPIFIDDIDTLSASPGQRVTFYGSGFSEVEENYVIVVVGAFPTEAVELDVEEIQVTNGNAEIFTVVGDAMGSFPGDLIVLEGYEIGISPVVFTKDARTFVVSGSGFAAASCERVGSFWIEQSGEATGGEPTHGPGSGFPATQPVATIWAQPIGHSLELFIWFDPLDPIQTSISHMIDPEDCGGEMMDVSVPGQIIMTYVSGHASSSEEFAEDLVTALQYAFADYEGVSVHSAGGWVTVELGREVRGDSILVQVFDSD